METFFIPCVMDVMEVQRVSRVNITGAFMHTLTIVIVRLLFKINPGKYEKYIIYFRGEEVIYVRLNKALHRTILGAMLLW